MVMAVLLLLLLVMVALVPVVLVLLVLSLVTVSMVSMVLRLPARASTIATISTRLTWCRFIARRRYPAFHCGQRCGVAASHWTTSTATSLCSISFATATMMTTKAMMATRHDTMREARGCLLLWVWRRWRWLRRQRTLPATTAATVTMWCGGATLTLCLVHRAAVSQRRTTRADR
jgi:hypothetical protein